MNTMAINKHKVLIYDDKHEDCDLLSEMIKKICGEENVEITAVETYEEAMDLAWDDYCAAFLDIRLDKDKDGIRFAERLRSRSKELKIIFVTAYIKDCEEIFRVDPSGFILKTVTIEKVKKSLGFLLRLQELQKAIVFEDQNKVVRLFPVDISYVEIKGRKLCFFDKNCDQMCAVHVKIQSIEKQLPSFFVRCHYSYIVNLNYTKSMQRHYFVLSNGKIIDIAQRKYNAVKDQYLHFLEEDL